ncbi:MAG: hypothetical protein GX868_03010 [Actinobacteria bacterium]|nr:hypothetical protein [Actinomycetota bacterium]
MTDRATLIAESPELDAYFTALAQRADALDIDVPPLVDTGSHRASVATLQNRRRSRRVLVAAAALTLVAGVGVVATTPAEAPTVAMSDPTLRPASQLVALSFDGAPVPVSPSEMQWNGDSPDHQMTTWVGGEVGDVPVVVSLIEAATLEELAEYELYFRGIRLRDFLFGTGKGAPVHEGVSAQGSSDGQAHDAPEGVMVRSVDAELNLDGSPVGPDQADMARTVLLYSLGDRYAMLVATGPGMVGTTPWSSPLSDRIDISDTDGVRTISFSPNGMDLFAEVGLAPAEAGNVYTAADPDDSKRRSVGTFVAGWGAFGLHDWNGTTQTLLRSGTAWVVASPSVPGIDGVRTGLGPIVRGITHGQYAVAHLAEGDDPLEWFDRIAPVAE